MGVNEEQARHVVAVAYRCAASAKARGQHRDFDPDDVAQDAAIRVLKSYDEARGPLEPFVAACVWKCVLDRRRKEARRKAKIECAAIEMDTFAVQPDLAARQAEALARAVCGVVRYGDILRRIYIDGEPQIEIATRAGRHKGRVTRWRDIALREAREILAPHVGEGAIPPASERRLCA